MANESDVDVWFDDVKISYAEAMVAQENHYPPFGLHLTGIEKQGSPDHKFPYNGKEKVADLGLNWVDYGARMYDAQLGRFMQIDPHASRYLDYPPYNYASKPDEVC